MKKLHTESSGQGPDIVLVHGWGLHSGIWQFVVAKLAVEFRVTTLDLPGFGRSEIIPDYTLENLINHFLPVMPENAIWIGWSLGGLIATKVASLYPERVRKLICVASSPKFVQERDWPGIDFAILEKFSTDLNIDYEATLIRFLILQFYGTILNKEMLRWLSLNLFLYTKPTAHALSIGLNFIGELDLRDAVHNLHCPVLYLLGKLDTFVPAKLAKHLLKKFKSKVETVVFPKASHALFLTHQNEFINEVKRFSYV